MSNYSPGFNPRRLVTLMQDGIQRCQLQLHGVTVLTEAATGAYAVTPVLAAMAGAEKVFAITRNSRYGTIEQAIAETKQLANLAGVSQAIEFITEKTKDIVAQADMITNAGHVRPIDAEMIAWMKPTAVIPLMYEAWEFRPEDVDLIACRQRGIKVAGINERHSAVDVFSFLGIMAIKLLLDAGVAVYTSNILLLCDNPFKPYIERGLINAGANLDSVANILEAPQNKTYDAILVALQPRPEPVLSVTDAAAIAKYWPGAIIAQYWGDIERSAFLAHDIPIWPEVAPKPGHMGILPSGTGPEAAIRLATGGLKVGEVLLQPSLQSNDPAMEFVQLL
ncbi:hypothetical protein [Fischerella sp. PCC 9605]|uniref:hypothetical protein n=1 Tax=Fischerella sp. PCC 9605 TaxID=1173024 RepID=UPI00047C9D41|nr:hypothetical protein [Fischerella sp. PCC 9605]